MQLSLHQMATQLSLSQSLESLATVDSRQAYQSNWNSLYLTPLWTAMNASMKMSADAYLEQFDLDCHDLHSFHNSLKIIIKILKY